MPPEKFTPAFTFTADRLASLKAIAPEAFNAEGQLDWEALRIALGDAVEDGRQENFGLNWPGKRAARRLALAPVHKALVPAPGEGVDEDTTKNIFIEGDNLDALKLLRKAYAGRVKMIYIDPPYNTGNDFVYKDDFAESYADYETRAGDRDESGARLISNPKSSGRFHSNWLNMIYPRLLLARELLRDDGVIFVSIDDNEVHNLRQVMDEVFGAENFVAEIVIQSNKRGQTYKDIAKTHEYLIVYGRTGEFVVGELPKDAEALPFSDERGSFDLWELRNRNPKFGRHNRANLFFPIYVAPIELDSNGYSKVSLTKFKEFNIEVFPRNSAGVDGCWRWSKHLINTKDLTSEFSELVARQRRDGEWNIYEKSRKSVTKAKSIWDETEVISEQGTMQLGELGLAGSFDHPKPIGLIQKLLKISVDESDLIVDFFGGSGTTAHAIWKHSFELQINLRFIVIQWPEIIVTGNFRSIADVSKERLRRAGKFCFAQKHGPSGRNTQNKMLFTSTDVELHELDTGFRVFKVAATHFKRWQDYTGDDLAELQPRLEAASQHPLRAGWAAQAVLSEIALQEGFPLDSAVARAAEYPHNSVQCVSHDSCAHRLFVCLDEVLHADTPGQVRLFPQDVFICFDHALSDAAKLRLADVCKLKVI